MTELSEYEKQRLRNIEYNKSVLLALGIKQTFTPIPRQVKDVVKKPKQGVKRKRTSENHNNRSKPILDNLENIASNGRSYLTRATRKKLGITEDSNLEHVASSSDGGDRYETPSKPTVSRENIFGSIPDVPVGTVWHFRLDCSRDGIHRPTVAGIHGGEEGCYSLALSGGYEDDLDYGECFTYTGEGGRDLKGTKANPKNLRTAPQSKDQTLTRGNLALSKNVENRNPVRVVRGYKLNSNYAPSEGYRYDGLYTVERFWKAVGLSGYQVYKFALKRVEDQMPAPWTTDSVNEDQES